MFDGDLCISLLIYINNDMFVIDLRVVYLLLCIVCVRVSVIRDTYVDTHR